MNPIDTSADCEPRGREPNPTAAGKSAGFAVIPMEMARDRRLKARHLVVLMALFHHYNAKRRQPVFPGRKKLSALTGLHMSTISAVTAELVAQGWITKSGKGGFSHATRYALNFAPTGSIAEKKTTTVSRAILATAATPSPSHCGDTPPSPQGRQDTLAIGAIRKKQSKETKEENLSKENPLGILPQSESVEPGAEKRKKVAPKKEKEIKPDLDTFIDYARLVYQNELKIDFSPFIFAVTSKFNDWNDSGWNDGNGKPILSWKNKLRNSIPYFKPINNNSHGNTKTPTNQFNSNQSKTRTGRQILAERLINSTKANGESGSTIIDVEAL